MCYSRGHRGLALACHFLVSRTVMHVKQYLYSTRHDCENMPRHTRYLWIYLDIEKRGYHSYLDVDRYPLYDTLCMHDRCHASTYFLIETLH